jgi:response regulator of citrate/malate metabolism
MRDVLVVDDDFMVAEIHRRFVEQVDGFRTVGVARTGADALSAVRELQPRLILLDVYLPDMTGLEVLQRLRSEGNRVGVIMITAARELDTVKGALDGGAADYLIKPFEFGQLKAKLEAFAARADALESAGGVDQSLIDSLFGAPSAASSPHEVMPKGLGAETGRLVLGAVRDAGEVSAAECADLVGISRVSARRYLEHYLGTGALELRLQYGVGRPERRYRLGGV